MRRQALAEAIETSLPNHLSVLDGLVAQTVERYGQRDIIRYETFKKQIVFRNVKTEINHPWKCVAKNLSDGTIEHHGDGMVVQTYGERFVVEMYDLEKRRKLVTQLIEKGDLLCNVDHLEDNVSLVTVPSSCIQYHIQNGQLHGQFRQWNVDSTVMVCELNFEKGKLEGVCTQRHENGTVLCVQTYRAGRLCGLSRMWSMSGQLVAESVHDGNFNRIYYRGWAEEGRLTQFKEQIGNDGKVTVLFKSDLFGKYVRNEFIWAVGKDNHRTSWVHWEGCPDDGIVEQRVRLNQGFHGTSRTFDASGQIVFEMTYDHGRLLHGRRWYPDGTLCRETMEDGMDMVWDKEGRLERYGIRVDNNYYRGLVVTFRYLAGFTLRREHMYPTAGDMQWMKTYRDDLMVCEYRSETDLTTWYPNGNVKRVVHGNSPTWRRTYFANGQLKTESSNRFTRKWFKNGRLKCETIHNVYPRIGHQYQEWYSNGARRVMIAQLPDSANLRHITWYRNGNVKAMGDIDSILHCRIGMWEFFYENGSMSAEGEQNGSRRLGFWNFWDEQGTVTTRHYNETGQEISWWYVREDPDGGTTLVTKNGIWRRDRPKISLVTEATDEECLIYKMRLEPGTDYLKCIHGHVTSYRALTSFMKTDDIRKMRCVYCQQSMQETLFHQPQDYTPPPAIADSE